MTERSSMDKLNKEAYDLGVLDRREGEPPVSRGVFPSAFDPEPSYEQAEAMYESYLKGYNAE